MIETFAICGILIAVFAIGYLVGNARAPRAERSGYPKEGRSKVGSFTFRRPNDVWLRPAVSARHDDRSEELK